MKKLITLLLVLTILLIGCSVRIGPPKEQQEPTEPEVKLHKIIELDTGNLKVRAIVIDDENKLEYYTVTHMIVPNPETGVLGKYLVTKDDEPEKIIDLADFPANTDPKTIGLSQINKNQKDKEIIELAAIQQKQRQEIARQELIKQGILSDPTKEDN